MEMRIKVNEEELTVPEGATVAAALMSAGISTRKSVKGSPRAPLCGMGICYECRAEVDGTQYERTCMVLCQEGMEVKTK